MLTITIQVKPYLASYVYRHFRTALHGRAVLFSCHDYVYYVLLDLTWRRPKDISGREEGNLTLVLPKPAHGKRPEVFNYLSKESAAYLEEQLETRMNVELFEFLLNRKEKGFSYKDSAYRFWETYQLEGIDPDSLLKRFNRWREKDREQRQKERK